MQNYSEAVRWHRLAAEQGHADAQSNLGVMYDQGLGVPQDVSEAVRWYRLAAEQGVAAAQSALGWNYLQGRGVPQDDSEAVRWYRLAAEQGDADAQSNLGVMYSQGRGVPQDDADAVRWYRLVAEQGGARAQHGLGLMYFQGRGVPEDYIRAYKWLNLAAAQGNAVARSFRDRLREQMSSDQVAEAQRLSREFRIVTEAGASVFLGRPASATPRISGSGSGFFITTDGYVITANHVIQDAERIEVLTKEGVRSAVVVRTDPANDVALLKVDTEEARPLAIIRSGGVRAGDEVFTLGFPNIQLQGTEAKFTQGHVSSLTGFADDPRLFQISVAVQQGNSGGPLLNNEGRVVGMVVGKLDEVLTAVKTGSLPQNVNYALKGSFVLSFLEAVPELASSLTEPTSEGLSRAALVEASSRAVVLVLAYQ